MIDRLSCCYFNKGLSYARENDLAKATDHLKKAVALNNKNTSAWNLLGLCSYRLGEFGMAELCWNESVKNGDSGAAADYLSMLEEEIYTGKPLIQKAIALSLKGEYRKAYKLLNRDVLEGMAETKSVLNFKGLLKCLEGKESKALKLWTASMELDHINPQAVAYIHHLSMKGSNMEEKR